MSQPQRPTPPKLQPKSDVPKEEALPEPPKVNGTFSLQQARLRAAVAEWFMEDELITFLSSEDPHNKRIVLLYMDPEAYWKEDEGDNEEKDEEDEEEFSDNSEDDRLQEEMVREELREYDTSAEEDEDNGNETGVEEEETWDESSPEEYSSDSDPEE